MALVTTKRNVDVLPGQAAPTVFHCSQHDVGATIILGLVNAGGNFPIPSGVTAIIQGSCSNGAVFTPVTAAVSGSDITFNLSAEMTSIAGPTVCEAVLSKDTDILGTANFILDVEPSAMGSDTPPVFTDAAWLWMVDKMGSETVSALGDKTVIDAINGKADQSDVTALSDAKLDKNQGTANAGKYLKVGANGDVETADLDVTTDKTLSITDKAADAKAVGDELDDLKADLNDFESNTFDITYAKNLYNPDEDEVGKYLNPYNGNIEDYAATRVTGFMPVEVGKYITFSQRTYAGRVAYTTNSLLFYDSSKTYIPDSGATYVSNKIVPSTASFVRVAFGNKLLDFQAELTDDGVFTPQYEAYHNPVYSIKDDIVIPADQVVGISEQIESETVKGTNLVPISENGTGAYYASGSRIVYDASSTSLHYAIMPVKQNTDYFVNFSARFWILTDDNDTVLSSGASVTGFVLNTGNATKLYYTVYNSEWNVGLIVAEGYHGTNSNLSKPSFINGLNQLTSDSWFAVALTPGIIRFTVGIPEKLYYFNILSLAKNKIQIFLSGTREDDGIEVDVSRVINYSNVYGYDVFDDNLSIVETSLRGARNRMSVYADNINDCSVLIIGDSIVARNNGLIGRTMLSAFSDRGKNLTLLGTLGSGDSKNEGRPGWTAANYFTDKQYEGVTNPFYNPTSQTFDFGYYMQNAGYSEVDFVVIHLGGNDLFSVAFNSAREKISKLENDIFAMIDSIIAWNPAQKIIIQLAPTISPNGTFMRAISGDATLLRAKFTFYNAEMLVRLTKYYNNVRCSNDYMIVDPINDMADHIHPNDTGLAKIGMELVSQINCWQADIT